MPLKKGDEVFVKHLPFAKAIVVGPRPGDVGTPQEKSRIIVKIAEEQRICEISQLEVEKPRELPDPTDWQKANQAVQEASLNPDDKELREKSFEALRKIGLLVRNQ